MGPMAGALVGASQEEALQAIGEPSAAERGVRLQPEQLLGDATHRRSPTVGGEAGGGGGDLRDTNAARGELQEHAQPQQGRPAEAEHR